VYLCMYENQTEKPFFQIIKWEASAVAMPSREDPGATWLASGHLSRKSET